MPNSCQIGVRERGPFGQPVKAAGHLLNLAPIPESVQCSWVDAQPKGLAGTQHALMPGEYPARLGKAGFPNRHWIDLTDIFFP